MNIIVILPIALVGAIIGLLLCHMSMSMVALIGIIMLIGVVSKNSILVVDYTNTLRARGYGRNEALLEAGPTRMRPVLMTSSAIILGMLPTALAVNEGSEWRAPMAVAVIFGVMLATMLSLVVVPASYVIWDKVGNVGVWIGRKLAKPSAEE
jgi:HAE1 family hydrophobic/amphiphilic exporter-1